MKKLLIHRHQYGVTTAVCDCINFTDADILALEEDQVIKLAMFCGIEFEPHKDETLDFVDVDNKVTKVTKTRIFGKKGK